MRMMITTLLTSLFASTAQAAFPDDVVLSEMHTWRGDSIDNPQAVGQAYDIVVRQLGAGIMTAPVAPSETLGLNGFDVAFTNTWAFLSARADSVNTPAPWERVHTDEDPTHVMWRPGLTIRKGLPLSLEVGGSWSWIGFSRQTAIGGFGRWSVFEGWEKAPDVTMQLGYTGYVGNDELELGALDGSMSFGYTFPVGYILGVNQADLAPFGGVGFLKINAAPLLSKSEQNDLGISQVSGFKNNDAYTEGFTHVTTHLGLRIRSGDFNIAMSGMIVPKALPTVNMSVGLTY